MSKFNFQSKIKLQSKINKLSLLQLFNLHFDNILQFLTIRLYINSTIIQLIIFSLYKVSEINQIIIRFASFIYNKKNRNKTKMDTIDSFRDKMFFNVEFSDSQEQDSKYQEPNSSNSQNPNNQIINDLKIINSPQIKEQEKTLQQKKVQQSNNSEMIFQKSKTLLINSNPNHNQNVILNKVAYKPQIKRQSIPKSPFIQDSQKTKSDSKYHAILNMQNLNQRLRTKQKKKIQILNETQQVDDLEEIKLDKKLKRSDTQKTAHSFNNNQLQQQKNNHAILQDTFQHNLIFQQNQSENLKNNVVENQVIKPLSSFQTPWSNFRQFKTFQFDSQSSLESSDEQKPQFNQNEISQDPNQESHNENENSLRDQGEQNSDFSVFSDYYKSKEYLDIRKGFLAALKNTSLERNKETQNIKRLLVTEIPENNMFEFQVNLYKDFFKTQYQLWAKVYSLNNQQQQSFLIANAHNDSFHIDKSVFIIEQVNSKNYTKFIGQLESNFARDFYSLHGYHKPQSSVDNCHQNNTYFQQLQEILNVSLNQTRFVYVPNKKVKNINNQKSYLSKNKRLRQKYHDDRFIVQKSVIKMVTSRSFDFNKQFFSEMGIRKSKKTLLIEKIDTNQKVLFIGKIASKKYKLMVGQGLSPLQAFGILISHVQSN